MTPSFRAGVVIPAHDGLPDVLDAVDSALGQTLPPAEVIVVDDASRDGTGEAVRRRFGARVQVVDGRFGSAAAARNAGWSAARSEWIGFLDADDLWFPDKLAVAAATLERHPQAGWFFSDGAFRTLDGTLHESWLALYADLPESWSGRPLAQLLDVNFVLTSSVVVRRDLLAQTGGFDETMSHAEDLDLWIRLSRATDAAAAGRPLVRYQHRPGGLTRQVVARLNGDVFLFRRLAADPTLPAALRARARRRLGLAHYKLAMQSLRAGRHAEARLHLRHGMGSPGRLPAVTLAWTMSWLPPSLLARLRAQRWATRSVGPALSRLDRVTLRQGETEAASRRAS